ncbi:hypothetical protein DU002_14970 [Corallincola holothuriorum]|uniref:Uncharacterized protein n=1 Tax=Corallincola holothuriorum TaxID=2282215 RepID=A0A368N871_9GAMM|nr:hypothetical protein DU002_14970 [Corallincola holothuriorum]
MFELDQTYKSPISFFFVSVADYFIKRSFDEVLITLICTGSIGHRIMRVKSLNEVNSGNQEET